MKYSQSCYINDLSGVCYRAPGPGPAQKLGPRPVHAPIVGPGPGPGPIQHTAGSIVEQVGKYFMYFFILCIMH